MIRGKWTINEHGQLVDYVEQRAEVNAPYILTDEIPGGVKSMADRQVYTSKSRLRESYRRLGKVELGNDWDHAPSPQRDDTARHEQMKEDIAKAYYAVRDNMAPLSERDKAMCEVMNKQIRENTDDRPRDRAGNVSE